MNLSAPPGLGSSHLRINRALKSNEGQWKVLAFPGHGFFADYENIYRKKLPKGDSPKLEPEPLVYLTEFHKQLGHPQEEFASKEVTYVRDLLGRYSDQAVRDLLAFG